MQILSIFTWPIIIIGLIYYFSKKRGDKSQTSGSKDRFLQIAFSKEDTVSQWYWLLSMLLLGATLLTVNRDLGDPLAWRSIILVTTVYGFVIAYYFNSISVLAFSLISASGWWSAQALVWIQEANLKSSTMLAGLMFIFLLIYVFGLFHQHLLKYPRFAHVYLVLGIIFITFSLLIFSTNIGINLLNEMSEGVVFFSSWKMTGFLFLPLVVLATTTLFLSSRKVIHIGEAMAVLVLGLLFLILALLPTQQAIHYDPRQLSGNGALLAIFMNLASFFELLGLIFSGYLRRAEWLINLGSVFLFIFIIVKYFDWFFTFLDKSLFFISAGIILFALGWFMEKSRRYMIASIKTENHSPR